MANPADLIDILYTSWRHDHDAGILAVMVPTNPRDCAILNARAHEDFTRNGSVTPTGHLFNDGTKVGINEVVYTRINSREHPVSDGTCIVHGHRWIVDVAYPDGALDLQREGKDGSVHLPAEYVREHLQLAYAIPAWLAPGLSIPRIHIVAPRSDADPNPPHTLILRAGGVAVDQTTRDAYIAVLDQSFTSEVGIPLPPSGHRNGTSLQP